MNNSRLTLHDGCRSHARPRPTSAYVALLSSVWSRSSTRHSLPCLLGGQVQRGGGRGEATCMPSGVGLGKEPKEGARKQRASAARPARLVRLESIARVRACDPKAGWRCRDSCAKALPAWEMAGHPRQHAQQRPAHVCCFTLLFCTASFQSACCLVHYAFQLLFDRKRRVQCKRGDPTRHTLVIPCTALTTEWRPAVCAAHRAAKCMCANCLAAQRESVPAAFRTSRPDTYQRR